MKKQIKIKLKIEEKGKKTVYERPTVEKMRNFPTTKAKLNAIFHSGGTVTISVWYPQSSYNKDDPDNQIICHELKDWDYARKAFIEEYL